MTPLSVRKQGLDSTDKNSPPKVHNMSKSDPFSHILDYCKYDTHPSCGCDLVQKTYSSNEDVSTSIAASSQQRQSLQNEEICVLKRGEHSVTANMNSRSPSGPHPNCSHDQHPNCSSQSPHPNCNRDRQTRHPSLGCDSINDQPLARYASDISKEMSNVKSNEMTYTRKEQRATNQECENNRKEQGKDDALLHTSAHQNSSLRKKRTDKTSLPDKPQSGKVRLVLSSSQQNQPSSQIHKSCLKMEDVQKIIVSADESDSEANIKSDPASQNPNQPRSDEHSFTLVRPDLEKLKNCHQALCMPARKGSHVNRQCLESDTVVVQFGLSSMMANLELGNTPQSNDLDSVPTCDGEEYEKTSNKSSDPPHQETEISDYLVECWTCQRGDSEQVDNNKEIDGLSRNKMEYTKGANVCSQRSLTETVLDKHSLNTDSLQQSTPRDVVYYARNDSPDSGSTDEVHVLNLSPITTDSLRTFLVEGGDQVLNDRSKQNAHDIGQSSEDYILGGDKTGENQIKTGRMRPSSGSTKSSVGDEIIIVLSSTESDSTKNSNSSDYNEIQLRRLDASIENKDEEKRLQELVSGSCAISKPIEREKEKLEMPSNEDDDDVQQHEDDDRSQSILPTDVTSGDNRSANLKNNKENNPTQITREKIRLTRKRITTQKGKAIKTTDLYKAFPRMPGWQEDAMNGPHVPFKTIPKHERTNKMNKSRCKRKRKLYNTNTVLEHSSPVAQKELGHGVDVTLSKSMDASDRTVCTCEGMLQTSSIVDTKTSPAEDCSDIRSDSNNVKSQDHLTGTCNASSSLFTSDSLKGVIQADKLRCEGEKYEEESYMSESVVDTKKQIEPNHSSSGHISGSVHDIQVCFIKFPTCS